MIVISSKKKRFNIISGKREIETLIDKLPNDDECYKFISNGGFSSICFIMYIASKTKIHNLHVSTFRVGKKEIQTLHALKSSGKLENAEFVVFSLMKDDDAKGSYGYFDIFKRICDQNRWGVRIKKNHSKVLLFDTDDGKFVIETSSNLNENPKVEQFSFEKDAELYDFYIAHLFGDSA